MKNLRFRRPPYVLVLLGLTLLSVIAYLSSINSNDVNTSLVHQAFPIAKVFGNIFKSQVPIICPIYLLNGPEAIAFALSQKHRSFVMAARRNFECHKLPHFNMCLYDKASDDTVSRVIRSDNMWEGGITNSISDALKMYPNAQFIDIGGFIGWHSFHAVATLNRSAVIVDPFVDNIYLMGSTLVRNNFSFNSVRIFPYCVYADTRSFNAAIDIGNPGATPIDKKLIVHVEDKYTNDSVELNCVTLDDLANCIDFTQAVMKIDIERSEFSVFTSNTSSAIFEKIDIPVVFMEWGHLKTLAPNASKLIATFFLNRGYSPYHGYFANKQPLVKNNSNSWPFDMFWVKPGKTK